MTLSSKSRLVIFDDTPFDPESTEGQETLARAYEARARVKCLCHLSRPVLYIARHATAQGSHFVVKRLPGTGHLPAPDCPSFDPPEELSGLADLRKAVRMDEITDTAYLTLAFPLTQAGKHQAPPPSAGSPQTEVTDKPGRLSLSALLQFLWHEAALTTWVPAMAGKRNWYIVRRELLRVSAQMAAKGFRLRDRLVIPERFVLSDKDAITERRGRFLEHLMPAPGQPRALCILIAPLKEHASTAYGGKLTFSHLPDMPVFVSREMYDRICDKFAERLMLADTIDGATPVLAGLMGYSDSGFVVLHEAALMVVTQEWLPVENARDVQVIARLVLERRRFQRQLRFTLKSDAPIATAVLTDTPEPHALFCTSPQDVSDGAGRIAQAAEEGVYPSWIWKDAGTPPAFPARETFREVASWA